MSNKEINDLSLISSLANDTNFEVQDAAGGLGSSKRANSQTILDYVMAESIWAKLELNGDAMATISCTTAASPLDTTGYSYINILAPHGVSIDNFGLIQNNTGVTRLFDIVSYITLVGLTTPNNFVFYYQTGNTNPPTDFIFVSQQTTQSIVATRTEIVLSSTLSLADGEYAQPFVSTIDGGGPHTLRLHNLYMKVTAQS